MTYIPSLHKAELLSGALKVQPEGLLNVSVVPKVEAEQIQDLTGDTFPGQAAYVKKRWSEGEIEGVLNYENAYMWFDGMFGEATLDSDTRTWTADADWDSDVVEAELDLTYGQAGLIYDVQDIYPSELQIAGASGEPVRFSYKWFGQPVTDGASFTTDSDLTTHNDDWVMGHDVTLYIEQGVGSTPGTTPVTGAFSFEARISNDRAPVWHLGNQAPDAYRNGKWGGQLQLVIEADATQLSFLGDALDATADPLAYVVRLEMIDQGDSDNVINLDFVGHQLTAPTLIPDLDGIVTVEMTLVPTFGSVVGSVWAASSRIG